MKPINNLSKELSENAKSKWDAFCIAAGGANIKPPEDPAFLAVLKQVFAFSDFVARSCIRYPEMLNSLIESGDLQRRYISDSYNDKLKTSLFDTVEEISSSCRSSLPEIQHILRRFRRREMVRIAWRDLAGWADLSETMADLSALADSCLQQALSLLHKRQCLKYGIPTGSDGSHQYLVALGMGKLGAEELNFSSDIDLIFAYPETGKTVGGPKSISNEEFFVRLCRCLLNVISAATPDGIVFRIDTRLRPYGENGPIVMSFDGMEAYYQREGREWERYAWIKARVVADEKGAGESLMKRLKPFVYRRYLDFGVFESLRNMKQQISMEVKRKKMKENIKLGPGGIREIEFFGQIFQLTRGGVTPLLQERCILKVLKVLVLENYISRNVCDELTKAYVFLRNTEHRLQEFSDRQTHKLPSDYAGRCCLAASMGFDSWESFALHIGKHTEIVHRHFNKLLTIKEKKPEDRNQIIEAELKGIWQNLVENEQAKNTLSAIGFDQPDEALRLLDHLRNDRATRTLSIEGRNRLNKLIPFILKEIGKSERPAIALNRIVDLIKTIEKRSCYIALLLENPAALSHLVRLSNASPWIVSFLAHHPVLLDELLDPRTLYSPPERSELEKTIRRKLELIPPEDIEYQIQELCIFKQMSMLRVAAADVTGAVKLMKVSDYLTSIAEIIVNKVLESAWNHLIKKYGMPTSFLNGKTCGRGFAVIAYGKLGGFELGYDSDLDLVFLHAGTAGQTKGGVQSIDNAQFFARLGQRVVHILTTHTSAGRLYEVDMRLRPSGSSGLLVSHIEAFEDYQAKKARTWEHQAIIKARAISGDDCLVKHFEQIRKNVLSLPRIKAELQEEVGSMREHMRKELLSPEPGIFDLKQGAGGIVDIEFLVQYLVLLKSCEHVELLKWTDNVRLLETLIETGIIDWSAANVLKEAYLTCRSAAHRLSLQKKPAKVSENKFRSLRERVKEIWKVFIEER